MCGVRNSHFTLRIEIVGAFPTLVEGVGLWPSLLGTGISYNKGYRLETVTLSEMFMLLHKRKCCAFQHFQLILPTYLKKKHIVEYMQIMRMYILVNRWATRNLWSTQAWSSMVGKWFFRHQANPTESAAHLILEPVHQKVHYTHKVWC
jgi:hypothetical protein